MLVATQLISTLNRPSAAGMDGKAIFSRTRVQRVMDLGIARAGLFFSRRVDSGSGQLPGRGTQRDGRPSLGGRVSGNVLWIASGAPVCLLRVMSREGALG